MSTALHDTILTDISNLNQLLNTKFTINDLPENLSLQSTGVSDKLTEDCNMLLKDIKDKIKEYRKAIHSEDQKKLSQFMKNINGEEAMSEEMQKWWMNRY